MMNRIIYCLALYLIPVCVSAQNYSVIAQPVVCMIQTDEVQSVVVEPSAAISSDDKMIVQYGFIWKNPEELASTKDHSGEQIIPGDANGDGAVNVTDIVEMVNYILGSPSDKFIFVAADVNGDGNVNVTDIVMVVNIILSSSSREINNIDEINGLSNNFINQNDI